jgi:hypothetical protein
LKTTKSHGQKHGTPVKKASVSFDPRISCCQNPGAIDKNMTWKPFPATKHDPVFAKQNANPFGM